MLMSQTNGAKPVRSLQGFGKILLESIDDSLVLLGEKSKSTLYHHLKTSFDMRKYEIAQHPDLFYNHLERIFGSKSAQQLQVLFLKKLNEKLGCSCVVVQLQDFFNTNALYNRMSNEV
jgi:hypothetical protein